MIVEEPESGEGEDDAEPRSDGSSVQDGFHRQLVAAREGDRDALGRAIQPFRQFLLMIAERELAPELKTKEGASDLVQDTLLEAHRHFPRFEGETKAEMRAWLRRLLLHRVSYTVRRYRKAGKRQLSRELSLGATDSSRGLAEALAGDSTSPSGQVVRREEEAAMLAALDTIPERLRQVIIWRHREDCSFDEIGKRLNRSNVAARKLWLRAIEQLQRAMKLPPDATEDPR
jgi:RNA polymerase sigma-70 factor, ECF subfamily